MNPNLDSQNYSSQQSNSNSTGQTYGNTRPSNVWTKNGSCPANTNSASAMVANTNSSQPITSNWIPDSGASFHVNGEAQNIQQPESFKGPDQIFIGNGQGLHIKSTGSFFTYNSKVSFSLNQL